MTDTLTTPHRHRLNYATTDTVDGQTAVFAVRTMDGRTLDLAVDQYRYRDAHECHASTGGSLFDGGAVALGDAQRDLTLSADGESAVYDESRTVERTLSAVSVPPTVRATAIRTVSTRPEAYARVVAAAQRIGGYNGGHVRTGENGAPVEADAVRWTACTAGRWLAVSAVLRAAVPMVTVSPTVTLSTVSGPLRVDRMDSRAVIGSRVLPITRTHTERTTPAARKRDAVAAHRRRRTAHTTLVAAAHIVATGTWPTGRGRPSVASQLAAVALWSTVMTGGDAQSVVQLVHGGTV